MDLSVFVNHRTTTERLILSKCCLSFQLYEIDDNPKRKEFLDELFSLMQKRGKCSQKISLFTLLADPAYFAFNFPWKFDSIIILVTCNEATPIIRQSSI